MDVSNQFKAISGKKIIWEIFQKFFYQQFWLAQNFLASFCFTKTARQTANYDVRATNNTFPLTRSGVRVKCGGQKCSLNWNLSFVLSSQFDRPIDPSSCVLILKNCLTSRRILGMQRTQNNPLPVCLPFMADLLVHCKKKTITSVRLALLLVEKMSDRIRLVGVCACPFPSFTPDNCTNWPTDKWSTCQIQCQFRADESNSSSQWCEGQPGAVCPTFSTAEVSDKTARLKNCDTPPQHTHKTTRSTTLAFTYFKSHQVKI